MRLDAALSFSCVAVMCYDHIRWLREDFFLTASLVMITR